MPGISVRSSAPAGASPGTSSCGRRRCRWPGRRDRTVEADRRGPGDGGSPCRPPPSPMSVTWIVSVTGSPTATEVGSPRLEPEPPTTLKLRSGGLGQWPDLDRGGVRLDDDRPGAFDLETDGSKKSRFRERRPDGEPIRTLLTSSSVIGADGGESRRRSSSPRRAPPGGRGRRRSRFIRATRRRSPSSRAPVEEFPHLSLVEGDARLGVPELLDPDLDRGLTASLTHACSGSATISTNSRSPTTLRPARIFHGRLALTSPSTSTSIEGISITPRSGVIITV